MFKKFIQRIIEAENREDAMQNVFYGNDGMTYNKRVPLFKDEKKDGE